MTTVSAIQVENVQFTYPDGREVLKGISCTINKGEKVALIGPNGAGKSTFMSLLNGVSLVKQGKVSISGLEVRKDNLKQIRRKIGIVFQDPDDQLFCPTVYDDVAFGPLNLGLPRGDIQQRVDEALETVGLKGYEQRSSFHLSFGERKRLALATVLSYQPDILVFDEPSTNMDPLNRRKLIDWLRKSDKTVLLCTHDLDIALDVCDRCLMLSGGRFVADGPASNILYDRELLEANHLELPLALMTHELLHEKLSTGQMDAEHKRIIASFLHAHRHAHGPGDHDHVHIHFHPHGHNHLHDEVGDTHMHESLRIDAVTGLAPVGALLSRPHTHPHPHPHPHDHDHNHDQGGDHFHVHVDDHDHPHPHTSENQNNTKG